MQRAVLIALLASGCGPAVAFVEPDLRSLACRNEEPIQISGVPGGFGGVRVIGDAWSVVTGTETQDGYGTFASYAVAPCGEVAEVKYTDGWASPAGDGWVRSDATSPQWAEHLDGPPWTLPISGSGWLHTFDERGLFVLDEPEHELLLFETPATPPIVVATDVDPDAIAEQHQNPIARLMPPYAIDGNDVWYVSEAHTLVHVDLPSGQQSVVAQDIRGLHTSSTNDIIAWVQPTSADEGAPLDSTILQIATGETFRLPGAVRDLDFPGIVVTGSLELVVVHDLASDRTRSVSAAPNALVIRADASSAFLVVEDGSADHFDDVVHLDMATGTVRMLAERLAERLDARPDPHSAGILVFAPDSGDARDYGRILRFTASSTEVVAEDISGLHRVAADGRVAYVDYTGMPYTGDVALRIRNPDGSDRLVARDAFLYDGLRLYQTAAWPTLAGIQGDILYNIETGPDRGMWRMPFDGEEG